MRAPADNSMQPARFRANSRLALGLFVISLNAGCLPNPARRMRLA